MSEMNFGWPVEMLVKAARPVIVSSIAIHYRRRSHGRSKVAGTISGSLKAAYYMLRTTCVMQVARETYRNNWQIPPLSLSLVIQKQEKQRRAWLAPLATRQQ